MKKKRIISIILSLITMFSAFSAYAISDSEALDRGISYGWAEYDHDESITRAEFAEMMLRFAAVQVRLKIYQMVMKVYHI